MPGTIPDSTDSMVKKQKTKNKKPQNPPKTMKNKIKNNSHKNLLLGLGLEPGAPDSHYEALEQKAVSVFQNR